MFIAPGGVGPAVVPEMVNLVRSACAQGRLPLRIQRSLEDLLEADRIQREAGLRRTLHAIEAPLQHRSRCRNDGGHGGVFVGLGLTPGWWMKYRIVRRSGD